MLLLFDKLCLPVSVYCAGCLSKTHKQDLIAMTVFCCCWYIIGRHEACVLPFFLTLLW